MSFRRRKKSFFIFVFRKGSERVNDFPFTQMAAGCACREQHLKKQKKQPIVQPEKRFHKKGHHQKFWQWPGYS
jgi:hypothetical protein